MAESSMLSRVKRLDALVRGLFVDTDVMLLDPTPRHVLTGLRRELGDARLDIRDYEFADTKVEQLVKATLARDRLNLIRKAVLDLSEFGLVGAADVAQLSAIVDDIIDELAP